MKALAILALLASIPALADSSITAKRDTALREIHACLRHNEASSHQCDRLNANVQVLVDAYRQGDKTVLPTLFMFPYQTDFFGDALLNDPAGFLAALNLLPPKDQKEVATGLAGGILFLRTKDRFDRIAATLRAIPESQPIYRTAQVCLKEVERQNAIFLISYFPPGTFTPNADNSAQRFYSAGMYALGEEPLWPVRNTSESIYRLTRLSAFGKKIVITLVVAPGGAGEIAVRSTDNDGEPGEVRHMAIASDKIAGFLSALDRAHFWQSPAELPAPHGWVRRDGAEWIMEGVKDGNYRVVVRWSPGYERQNEDEIRFADAGNLLIDFSR